MRTGIFLALLTFGLMAVGCGDDDEGTPPPTTGAIEVVAVTTGEDIDADGYTVTLDGVDGPSVGANSSVSLPNLTAGTYSVGLDGIAANCQMTNNPRDVSVVAGQTATAQFDVTCEGGPAPNQRPVADAGEPQSLPDTDQSGYETVTLDGSGSTDDGSIASWSWSLNGVEFGTGETLTVSADVGVYTVVLTVTDEEGETDTDDVVITVVASGENMPPVAHAGQNQSVEDTDDSGDEEVTLVGINSTDSDGTIASMSWSENSVELGTGVTLNSVFDVGTHTVTLTVTDDIGDTDTDDVTITVVPFDDNLPPVAYAGEDRVVIDDDYDGCATVTLDGSGSTDDGMIVGWQWNRGSAVIGQEETVEYTLCTEVSDIGLTVFDDSDASDNDQLTIVVRPATMDGVVVFELDNYDLEFAEADLLRADISNLNDDIAGPCQPAGSNWDNCISSIRVTEGWTAILFEDFDFEGDSLVVTENLSDMDDLGGADWDNRASSIKIRPPN